jgi:hypothetical protein
MRFWLGPPLVSAMALAACTPSAPPAKDYSYPAWGFKAAFPLAPTETPKAGAADGSPNSDLIEASGGGRDFAVWAADVSQTRLSLDDLALSSSQHVAQGLSATPSIQAYAATAEGVMGREFSFTKDGRWAATMRVFLANGRFYEVIGKSFYGQEDPALKDFMFSFHTLGPAPAANAAW